MILTYLTLYILFSQRAHGGYISSVPISDYEIVVARYNEDISWVEKNFPDAKVTIYNKGKDDIKVPANFKVVKLPNLGREGNTYLYHIIHNYDNLSEVVAFFQGNPFDTYPFEHHGAELIENLKNKSLRKPLSCNSVMSNFPLTSEYQLKKFYWTEDRNCYNKEEWPYSDTTFPEEYPTLQSFSKAFGIDDDPKSRKFCIVKGAIFAVKRESIQNRSKNFYEKLLNGSNLSKVKSPAEGHYLEAIWDLVFSPKNSSPKT